MTELEALVSLNLTLDIAGIRLKRLLEVFGKPQNILAAPRDKLLQVQGIGAKIAAKICALKKEDADRELKAARKLGLKIIALGDEAYPRNLAVIPDPPIVLYVMGSLGPEDNLSIGIVGSRRASFYGLGNAEIFASELAHEGYTVISGMARGIDTCAHRGALKAGGRTVAVIGSGLRRIYPPENGKLAEEISRSGAVISEFPLDTAPLKSNFPRRNRVISGLSLGILVVEAARNSGALITADFALEQGREVFALPGKVDSPTSFGANGLIKQGAKLVSRIEDITEELLPQPVPPEKEAIDRRERLILARIVKEPVHLDELAEKTNLEIPEISDILLRLQIKRLVRQLPGKQFTRL
ncbi:MAG: DNA-protecting protein DprA [Candidatus Omnitrophica bacterium]|nr:DNA-protecting protein DprA [Candidatus Omnitrophota bacterium]